MYTTTTSAVPSTYVDAKYTVADILSSMANGEVISPSFAEGPAVPNFASSVASLTTPTLTPTTLANIEQTFIELQSVPAVTTTVAQPQDLTRQSGFVPPIVAPIKQEDYDYQYDSSSLDDDDSNDWLPPSAKRVKTTDGNKPLLITPTTVATAAQGGNSHPPRKSGRRPNIYANMTPEEEQRRSVRRERNKLAAAKCRQRRVDHTNVLITETEQLEEEKATLENDIQTLQQQKEQLEFLLEAHKPMCSAKSKANVTVKVEPPVEEEKKATTTVSMSAIVTNASTAGAMSRPNSLPLSASKGATPVSTSATTITEATGIVISTPSNGMFATLGLDSMVDGHTGLTPITGAPSCASQAQRNSSDSSPNESLASPTRLMAL